MLMSYVGHWARIAQLCSTENSHWALTGCPGDTISKHHGSDHVLARTETHHNVFIHSRKRCFIYCYPQAQCRAEIERDNADQ